MADDFRAKVTAELDTEQLEKDLAKLQKKKVNIKVGTGAKGGIDDAGKSIDRVDKGIEKASKSGEKFGDTLKRSFKIGGAASVAYKAFRLVDKAASDAVESVKEFDAAITDLRMATNSSYEDARNLAKEYNTLAKELGATTTEVTSGADSWLRQGHSIKETNELVKNSTILAKVAKLEDADATKYLTSAMKGYNVEAQNTLGIVDKLTAVDLVSATEAGGLAEAMSRTAQTANNAGISMDKLIGYLAVVGETTQKSMSTVGESFKTIFARMADIKAEKLEFIDEDGTAESLSDVETVLNNLDIKLRDSNNEFRNFGDVLDEVAANWDNYSTVQQAAISKAFAGVRQSENFKVLMENYEQATSYMETAMNSSGTAASKFDAYLDSIEAKTKTLQATFEELAFNTISTETVSGIIEATTALVNFLDKSNLLKGTLTGLIAGGLLKAFLTLKTSITSAALKLHDFNSALKLVKAGNLGENEIAMLAKMTKNLSDSQLKAVLSSKALTNEQRMAILTANGLSESEAKAALSAMGLATAEGTATTTTFSLSSALKGLWATLMANPIILVITAVTAAATAFFTISRKMKEEQEAARQAMLEAGEAAKEEADSIMELHEAYRKAVEAYQNNTGSKEELESATSSLLKALGVEQSEIDKLVEKYGNLDDAINKVTNDALKNSIAELTSSYQASIDTLLDKTKDGFFTSWSLVYFKTEDQIDFAKYLTDKGLLDSGSYGSGGGQFYIGENESYSDIIAAYEKLIAMRDALNDSVEEGRFNREELAKSDLYIAINEKINSFSEEYQAVIDYINEINSIAAQMAFNDLSDDEIPKTKEEFEALKQSMIEASKVSGQYVGSQEQIEAAIVNTLSSIPEFKQFLDGYSDVLEETTEIDKVATALNEIRKITNLLNKAQKEFNETGSVSAETYNEVIALNEDYAKLFDFASGKIAIADEELNDLVDTIIEQYGATLAANGATEAQITQMVALANSLSNVKEETTDVVNSIKDLTDILKDAADGTEMSVFDTWELISTYPELASTITKTTNGYILEEEAIRKLIKAKAELLGTNVSEARMTARDNLIKNANNVEVANDIDKVFEAYYEKNGKNISSFVEFSSAYAEYFSDIADAWIGGTEEYVNAIIQDNAVNDVKRSLIEDMQDPSKLLTYEDGSIQNAFDELETTYGSRLQELEYLQNTYNNAIKSLENQGYNIPTSYYEKLKEVEEEKITTLSEELNALTAKFQEAITAGEIQEGTKEYYDMNNAINSVKESIQESNLALQEYSNTIRDLEWEKFDNIQEEISKITEEAEFLLNLFDNKELVDESGNLTEYGNAAMGLHGVNYNVYMEQAKRYAEELAKIESELATDAYNQDLIDRKEKLLDLQRKSILAAEEEKQAMVDLVTEGIEAELDALDDLINKYTEALDSAKDLYDYQNRVSDVTEEISKLQKQLIAYENDDSEETKALIQQLKVDLQEANEELQETEYDQFIADQKKLLDNLYTEYETILNRRIDDVDTLIIDSINAINTNAGDIKTTLETTASNLGISLSDKMSSIWTVDDEIKTVVSTYSGNFDTNAENVNGSLGTINSTIGTMNGVTTTISSTLSGIDTDIGTTNTTLSNINTAIGGLAGKLASEIAPLINTNNAGDASNPTDTSDGNSKPSGSAIQDKAPTTIYTDPNTTPTTKPETTKPSTTTPTTTTPKEKTGAEKLAEKIVKFGGASGSGMNAGKSGDNGIIKWNGNEYKVQNSGITYDSSTNLYKAAVEVLKFGDRQIFGYGGEIYGYLDGKIQKLEGRFWSTAGYDNFVNDVKGTYPAYAQGGLADFTGLAWMDGTKTKPEMVLDAEDTQNFVELKTVLAKMASNDISIGNSAYAGIQPMLYKNAFDVAGRTNTATSYTVNTNTDNHFETHIEIDHVLDYDDICNKLRDDYKFEKMIQAMTFGKALRKGTKYNYEWGNGK